MKLESGKEPSIRILTKQTCSEKFPPLPRTPTLLNFSCYSPVTSDTLPLQAPCFPGMWRRVFRYMVTHLVRQSCLIFKRRNAILLTHATLWKSENCIETSGTSQPVTQHHVPEERKLQLQLSYGCLFYDTVWHVHALYTSYSLLEDMWGWWYVAAFLPILNWETCGEITNKAYIEVK
jgi:hypothetical protein